MWEEVPLLHGLLVLLVCTNIVASLFALLAPLTLLVFVPPVAVALLAVVPPSTAAATEEIKKKRRVKKLKAEKQVVQDERVGKGQTQRTPRNKKVKNKTDRNN